MGEHRLIYAENTSGEIIPVVFGRLAEIYAVPPSDLLPMSTSDRAAVIDLDALAGSRGDDLIDRFLAAIQFLRREGSPDEVRDSDKAVIASLLESSVKAGSGSD